MQKSFSELSAIAVFLLAATPAFAQSVDEKIKVLEQELTQLKEQQVELSYDPKVWKWKIGRRTLS